jgi:predicted nucleic acid-binding protein
LSIYELEAGASHTLNLDLESKTRKAIASIRNQFKILPIPMEAGDEKIYGDQWELFKEWESPDLKKYRLGDKALQKYSVDLMIVTTAIRVDAILVTNDRMAAVVQEICSKFQWEDWLT